MRLAAVAKKTGMRVEIEIEGVIFRVAPDITPAQGSEHFKTLTEWQAWRDQERARQIQREALDAALDAPPEPIQPPFDHRERFAMERLLELGVGVKIHSCTIRSFGPHTQAKLLERGYVAVEHLPGEKFGDDEISLTKKGLADWNALRRHRDKYPSL
jgi:hypothetical protein